MPKLTDITHLVIDMDGVLYRGDQPSARLREFIAFLRQTPIGFLLVTNNSTRTPEQYADKLARMDAQVTPAEVLTSAKRQPASWPTSIRPVRAHVFGMDLLRQAMLEAGFVLADDGRRGSRQHGSAGNLRKGQARHTTYPRRGALWLPTWTPPRQARRGCCLAPDR
jgi:4-nitrophenyl phosphatase